MSDEEWTFFEPFATEGMGRPGQRCRTLDGIFGIARTGSQWRHLPKS